MRYRFRVILAALGLVAIVAIAASFAVPTLLRRDAPRPLTILLFDWPGNQVFTFAHSMYLDSQYGIALDLRRMNNFDDQLAALRAGQTHVQLNTLDTAARFAASDDMRIIYVTSSSFGGDGLLAVESIKTLADLRGQKIGVEKGNVSEFFTLTILERAGIREDEVTLIDVQADEITTALRSGRVSAVTTWEPNLSGALAKVPGLHLLTTSRDYPDLILDAVFVHTSALDDNRETYVNLLRAAGAAVQRCAPRMGPCLKALEAETGRGAEAWASDFSGLRLLDLQANARLFGDNGPGGVAARLQKTYDFLRRNRPDLPPADVRQWIDASLVMEAASP